MGKMRYNAKLLLSLVSTLVVCSAKGYQVWTSTAFTPNYTLECLPEWDRMAAGLQGLNINFTPFGFLPGEKPDTDQWKQILQTYPMAIQQAFQPLGRSGYESTWGSDAAGVTLGEFLQGYFDRADDWGYELGAVMLYDIRTVKDGPIYYWSESELADVRSWLDANGHFDVMILWNARQDSERERTFTNNPNVDGVLMEGNTPDWAANVGDRCAFLNWVSTNSNKTVIFQIPLNETEGLNRYVETRKFVRSLTATILGSTNTFVRSDRCVILPMVYSSCWKFIPEYEPSGNLYGDSMAGLLLSLMEQEDQFVGTASGGLISEIACESFERTNDLRAAVADGSLTNTATWSRAVPVPGDTNVWQSADKTIGSQGLPPASTLAFHGETLVVQSGGTLAQSANITTFSLNNLVLDGGVIAHGVLGSMMINLNGDTLYLYSGDIIVGGQSGNQNIIFQNANVSGNGTINIMAKGAGGSHVDFQSTVDPTGFRGTFNVCTNGILNLPPMPIASFGLNLFGSGKYRLDDGVAVTSLVIDGNPLPFGSYTFSDFTAEEQNNLIDGGGTLYVRSEPVALADGKLCAEDTWGLVMPEYYDGDAQIWKSGLWRLGVGSSAGSTELFNGGTLMVESGGEIAADIANVRLWSHNLTLDGGKISNTKINPFYINLTGGTFTLNCGTLLADSGAYNSDLVFSDGILAGNGTIEIAGTAANTSAEVVFGGDINTSGFSGAFHVTDNGVLTLPAVSIPSFALSLTGTGKYKLDSNIVVNELTIGGVSLDPGVYIYEDFTASQQAYLAETTGRIIVFGLPVALKSGDINDPDTWGGLTQIAGDTNIWRSLDYILSTGVEAYSTTTFNGHALLLETGSQLIPGAGGVTAQFNNLILDGGRIYNARLTSFTIDLTGGQMLLASGTICAGIVDTGRDVIIRNGSLVGSGIINIEAGSASGAEVIFDLSVHMSGFSGFFDVHDNGILNLPDVFEPTFGIQLSGSGQLVLDSDITVASLEIDGTVFESGTYTYVDFTYAEQAFLLNNGGTITVVQDVVAPILQVESGAGVLAIRSDNLDSGVTNTIQMKNNLASGMWSNVFSVTGTNGIYWSMLTTNHPQAFFRIITQ